MIRLFQIRARTDVFPVGPGAPRELYARVLEVLSKSEEGWP